MFLRVGLTVKMRVLAGVAIAFCGLLWACSPQTSPHMPEAGEQGDETSEESGFSWSQDSDCSFCHTAQSQSQVDDTYQLCASHGGADCTTCHADTEGLINAHEGVTLEDTKGAKKLKATTVSDETCLTCHLDDYTPEVTASVDTLTDKNGTTVNPHDLPDTATHTDNAACSNCHTMHSEKSVEEEASAYCKSCHHKEVYECNTCHEL